MPEVMGDAAIRYSIARQNQFPTSQVCSSSEPHLTCSLLDLHHAHRHAAIDDKRFTSYERIRQKLEGGGRDVLRRAESTQRNAILEIIALRLRAHGSMKARAYDAGL